MTDFNDIGVAAGRLLTKALQPGSNPVNDKEYRELLTRYEADTAFRTLFYAVAEGLELLPVSVDFRGAVVVPASNRSLFAVRLADLRATGLTAGQKAALLLTHLTIAALYFPSAEKLFDDNYDPPPVSERQVMDSLVAIAGSVGDRAEAEELGLPAELEPAWVLLASKQEVPLQGKRRTLSTFEGMVAGVFGQLREAGLVRLEADEESPRYAPSWRYIAQLRESTVAEVFKAVQQLLATVPAVVRE